MRMLSQLLTAGHSPTFQHDRAAWLHQTLQGARRTYRASVGCSSKRSNCICQGAGPAAVAAPPAGVPPADWAEVGSGSAGIAACSSTHFAELYIKDFALVEEQRVQLQPGLTVITGESGSGKSVLVEALGQLLGATGFDEAVRPPATTAVLEAAVAVAPWQQTAVRHLLAQLGLPERACREMGRLQLRRELSRGADGVRSRCFVNGSPTSVRVLRQLGAALVDVNGQHAALSLRDGAARLRLLDRLAGTHAAAEQLSSALAEWQQAQAQLRELAALSDEQQRGAMQRLVDEVHGAGIEEGEERRLRTQLRQLDGRRAAAERCRLVSVGLSGDGGGGMAEALREVQLQARQLLSQEERLAAQAAAEHEDARAAQQGDGQQQFGSQDFVAGAIAEEGEEAPAAALLRGSLDLLDRAQQLLDEAEGQVVEYARRYRFSQAEYDQISGRLQQLERLRKQYDATSCDELLEMAQRQEAALDAYFALEGRREELEQRERRLAASVTQQAAHLSRRRRDAAQQLQAAVEAVLSDLAMPGARFAVRITWTPLAATLSGRQMGSEDRIDVDEAQAVQCGEVAGRYRIRQGGAGLDAVEFLFAAGPAEPLRPLSAVASGGESARIMLALKAAPAFMLGVSSSIGSRHSGEGISSDSAGSTTSGTAADPGAPASGGQILVLDEVDSGIGSRLGQPIGRILRRMAGLQGLQAGQILCVSHLPQVAAHAEHHLCMRKASSSDNRVVTQFDCLRDRQDRLQEISAMLGLPAAAAEELLRAAAQP